MVQSPIVSLLGPRDRIGWAIRYIVLAFGAAGTVFAHDVITDQEFHGIWGKYLGTFAMIGLPLYAVATGIMVDMGRLRVQLISAAETDPLTGLMQRNAFLRATKRRMSQTGVLIMLDIDSLSDINTKYGTHAGDLCLMALAIRLRDMTRNTDLIGRIDGPTMAVFLPGTAFQDGMAIAHRLTEGLMVTAGNFRFQATASVGLVIVDGAKPLPQVLHDAEAALMRAKTRGQGTVMSEKGIRVA